MDQATVLRLSESASFKLPAGAAASSVSACVSGGPAARDLIPPPSPPAARPRGGHWQWLSPSLTAAPTRPESGNGDSLFPHHSPSGRSGGIGKREFPPHFPAKSESGIGGNGNWGFPGYSVGRLALLPVSGHTGSEVKLGWFYGDTCTIRTLTFKKLGPLAAPHATCPRPRAARSYHASNAPDLTPLGP